MRQPFVLMLAMCVAAPAAAAVPSSEAIDFNEDIRPILSNKCVICHGPDPGQRPTDLRLDVPEIATSPLDSGVTAIVPGKPKKSELVKRITTGDIFTQMPPYDSDKPLTQEEKKLLIRWIAEGAEFEQHWAYVPPHRPSIPPVKNDAWIRNPIDRFVLARLEAEGISPSPEADPYTLARRVALDLTGIPPSWPAVKSFAQTDSPTAYARFVDRLLASPAYGVMRARKWLDLARYADSAGYANDPPRDIWAYRDYVIRSYNENKPFDVFTIEQIAGDLLPNPTAEQRIATAFHRNTMTNSEGGTIDEEWRNVAIVDRVNTTMSVWMGTTMKCAQCHTHKYDPLTQTEYFELFAYFNNTADSDLRDESPVMKVYALDNRAKHTRWQAELETIETRLITPTPEILEAFEPWAENASAPLKWNMLVPATARTESGAKTEIGKTGVIRVQSEAKTDTYTITLKLKGDKLTGLRLATLPSADLPGGGAGYGGGNFVISHISARLAPLKKTPPTGRFVRITIPGKNKLLSLAEVEVFSQGKNIASQGTATQQGTTFGGVASRAIDGNTDGTFANKSTTHTPKQSNPWWEVDLGAVFPIEKIKLWNRTDHNLEERLGGAKVQILDENRAVVFETIIKKSPMPSRAIATDGTRNVNFNQATASFAQDKFPAAAVLGKPSKSTGWAVSPQVTESHILTLSTAEPIDLPPDSVLTVTISQKSKFPRHVLGQFRMAATQDPRASQIALLPENIQNILAIAKAQRSEKQHQTLLTYYTAHLSPQREDERTHKAALEAKLAAMKPMTTVPVMKQLPKGKRRETHLQFRGSYLSLGKKVSPGVPEVFQPLPEDAPPNRLGLARWLVDEDNPLTARVAVNRIWAGLFGRGLVLTSGDFGTQGTMPTHPKLLDWLAVEFMESGWDQKKLLRLIVSSATYRQTADADPADYKRDPDNRLLARGPRYRLPAETIRDQALAAADLLSHEMYGPPVRPPQPDLGLKAAFGGSTDWKTSEEADRYRRGLYTTWRRSNPYPSMSTFDAPNRKSCTIRRPRTNTPLQALVTLNDPVYVEAAQALGRNIARHSGTLREKITFGLQTCLLRPAREKEVAALVDLFKEARAEYQHSPNQALALATVPLGALPEGAASPTFAAWTVVANVILNLDEFLSKP